MAGQKSEQNPKSGGQQQQGGKGQQSSQQQGAKGQQNSQQQQGQPEEFQNIQGEIREQDYADKMEEQHTQERESRD